MKMLSNTSLSVALRVRSSPYSCIPAVLASILLISMPSSVFAANMFLVPQQSVVGTSEKIVVDVRIDSAGAGFNAAQATIRFPKDLLTAQVPDTKDSSFGFWLEQPTSSNEQGVVSFTGGAPYGVSGSSIQVLRLMFTPKGIGTANISIVDGAITSSDGTGTNILSTTTDTSVIVSPTRVSSKATSSVSAVSTIATSTLTALHVPILSSGLPTTPNIRVPLYPDSTAWYSHVSPFSVSWSLPSDVSGVNTAINRQSKTILPEVSKGIFDSESFDALTDGVWYMHVRFENNMGWGTTLHRRISVDTVPPLNFDVSSIGSKDLTTPTTTLQFKTSDALSGLQQYVVGIDGVDQSTVPATDFSGSFVTPVLLPGVHNIQVRAVDFAGNSVIGNTTFGVEPITSPVITFTSDQIYAGDNRGLTIKGNARQTDTVLFTVMYNGSVFERGTSVADDKGNWSFTSSQTLPAGTFVVHVQSRDGRGAVSEDVVSQKVAVIEKPVVQLGMFSLGITGATFLAIFMLLGGASAGWWLYRKRQGILFIRLSSAEADMAKIFTMMRADLEKLHRSSDLTGGNKLITEHLRENIDKFEKYLRTEIQRVNK